MNRQSKQSFEDRRPMRKAAPLVLLLAMSGCSEVQSALDPRSGDALLIATLWWGMLAVSGAVLLLVLILLLAALWQPRGRERAPLTARGAQHFIIWGGVVLPFTAALALVVVSLEIGREVAAEPEGAELSVEVVGRQWWWEVAYLDARGERVAVTANEIHVPVGREVRLLLKSDNVIHSFWLPQLQGKTDLIPGRSNATRLKVEAPGVYRGQCAEFCGRQHALMAFLLIAEEERDFADWLERQGQAAKPPETAAAELGRSVFLESGCPTCHRIRGTPAQGELGPDLTHIASRRTLAAATLPNTRGHLGGWVVDAQAIKPGTPMPSSAIAPERLRALLTYLGSLE